MKQPTSTPSVATIAAVVLFIATGVVFGILSLQIRLAEGESPNPLHLLLQFGVMLFMFCTSIPNARSKILAKVGIAYLVVCVFIGGFGVLGLYWELSGTAPSPLNGGLPTAIANTFVGLAAITLLLRGKNAFSGSLCPRVCALSTILYAGLTSWWLYQDQLANQRSEWLYLGSNLFVSMLAGLGVYGMIKGVKAYEKWMPGPDKIERGQSNPIDI